jgi:phytoene dehydrogenase-like protein
MRDVVVVGAGHNALVAACYLARAGLDVEVVERDTVAGGAVSTVERFPGYLVDRGSSAHIMVRRTGIVEELALDEVGLRYLDCDPWAFAPFAEPGGEQVAVTFWTDLDRTCDSIAAVCGDRDADAYARFVRDWGARNRRIFTAFEEPPTGRNLGRRLWGVGRGTGLGGAELARQFLQPADALLDATFADERLKTALAWHGAQAGPPTTEVGTADLVGWNTVLHDRPPGRPVGGSGALSQALVRRLTASGGRVRLGDGATRITTYRGEVTGVTTRSGEHVPARRVVAGCHVLTTIALLGNDELVAGTARRVRVGNGIGMVVRLGTTALPAYPAAPADGSAWRGLQLLARSRTQLREAYGDFASGRPPRQPAALAMSFSAVDPSIAPPGRHNVSVWGQWHPYALATGERWPDIAGREAGKLVAAVDALAPGFGDTIEHVHVQTPLDIEQELGLLRGNVMHVEMTLDAMFALRPVPEWAGYRGPVRGLYLCGASTHPGGGVSGASGRSAARVVLADLRGRRLRRVTRRGH